MTSSPKTVRIAQVAYYVGTALLGLWLAVGGLVAGNHGLSIVGVLVVVALVATRWFRARLRP